MEAIGKLHYRKSARTPTGFDAQHRPMHIWNGIGQVWGSVARSDNRGPRDDIVRFEQLGAGYSKYNAYDEAVREPSPSRGFGTMQTINGRGCCSSDLWRRISRSSAPQFLHRKVSAGPNATAGTSTAGRLFARTSVGRRAGTAHADRR